MRVAVRTAFPRDSAAPLEAVEAAEAAASSSLGAAVAAGPLVGTM